MCIGVPMTDEPPIDWDSLPPPTAPAGYGISLQGFDTQENAEKLGNLVSAYINLISRVIDLERLDGVTIAYDYPKALLELDRGFEASQPLAPTRDRAHGIAMAPIVLREGVLKSHIVLDANWARFLDDETHQYHKTMVYSLAHECGHVQDHKLRDIAFPGIIGRQRVSGLLEGFRQQFIDGSWDEYAASRVSASFDENQVKLHERTFLDILESIEARKDELLLSHRTHQDYGRVAREVSREYKILLQAAAYLLGHLDGLGKDLDLAPGARDKLEAHWFKDYWRRMSACFSDLWSRNGAWQSMDEFQPLADLGMELVERGGLYVRGKPDGGAHVNLIYPEEGGAAR